MNYLEDVNPLPWIGGLIALLFGLLIFLAYKASEEAHEKRLAVYAACARDPEYLTCRRRFFDMRGVSDPDAESNTAIVPMPIVIPSAR